MSNFNPTHEFRGLELEHHHRDGYVFGLGHYYDDEGRLYLFDPSVLTKVLPTPQPGEVWKYIGEYAGDGPDRNLVLISDETGPKFVNEEGDTIRFTYEDLSIPNFIKILNADGTPHDEGN